MDRARIMLKIRELESYLEELDELRPEDDEEYLKSLEKHRHNIIHQKSIDRTDTRYL